VSTLARVPNLDFPLCSLATNLLTSAAPSKIDENGEPVHDDCYVQSIKPFLVEPSFFDPIGPMREAATTVSH
jgi:hypothetical protein